jgi:tetratricopeptide (TPR) repeat protein
MGDLVLEAASLENVATASFHLGELENALKYHQQALSIANEVMDKRSRGLILGNMGNIFSILNEYEKALFHYDMALRIHKEVNDKAGELRVYINKAAVYQELGDYQTALKYNNDALSICGKESSVYSGLILNTNGNIYFKQKDYKTALTYYLQALDIERKIKRRQGEASALGNIGSVYMARKDYQSALEYFEKSLAIHRETSYKKGEARILRGIGHLNLVQGNHEKAEKFLEESLDIAKNLRVPEMTWTIFADLGHLYKNRGKHEDSLLYYRKAIEKIESVRGTLKSSQTKGTFIQNKIGIYENICNLLYDMHADGDTKKYGQMVFNYTERAKSRVLLDLLTESNADIRQHVAPELLIREKSLNREFSLIQTQLQTESAKIKVDSEIIKRLERDLRHLNQQFENLKNEMIRKNPKYAQLKYPNAIRLDEFQKNILDSSTVFLEYLVTDKHVFLMRMTKDTYKIFKFDLGREILQKQINRLREGILLKDKDVFTRYSLNLFQKILGPALTGIRKGQTLLISPDDILYLLPFEALVTRKGRSGKAAAVEILLERFPVHYAQSASVFAFLKKGRQRVKQSQRSKELFAMGDPYFGEGEKIAQADNLLVRSFLSSSVNRDGITRLTHSGGEVTAIARLFDKKDVFVRENAKEEWVKPPYKLAQYQYIHFATHGLLNQEKPELSGILLAQDKDPQEDGFLLMREIFNLEINADLVTLSACETALGKRIRSEGLVGLTQAWDVCGYVIGPGFVVEGL